MTYSSITHNGAVSQDILCIEQGAGIGDAVPPECFVPWSGTYLQSAAMKLSCWRRGADHRF